MAKKQKATIRELRVVFDTNPLHTSAPHELVNIAARNLIETNSNHPDLKISWYAPELVLHERHYQMLEAAEELLPSFRKISSILGIDISVPQEQLSARIEGVIKNTIAALGITSLAIDPSRVEWSKIIHDSVFRKAPFQPGKSEKGFRDRVIMETFAQLVESSPTSPSRCRLALVTNDNRLTEATKSRLGGSTNAEVISGLDDLRNLINVMISTVSESFVKELRERATRLFFVPKDLETLFYREKIAQTIRDKHSLELGAIPVGADTRDQDIIEVSAPRFIEKEHQRVRWVSQIKFKSTAYKTETPFSGGLSSLSQSPSLTLGDEFAKSIIQPTINPISLLDTVNRPQGFGVVPAFINPNPYAAYVSGVAGGLMGPTVTAPTKTPVKHGTSTFDVSWSATIDKHKKLVRPAIDAIAFIETDWNE